MIHLKWCPQAVADGTAPKMPPVRLCLFLCGSCTSSKCKWLQFYMCVCVCVVCLTDWHFFRGTRHWNRDTGAS